MTKHYEQRKEANARWAAKQERFSMYLDPQDKEEIAEYCKARGESMTAFFLRCARKEMQEVTTMTKYTRKETSHGFEFEE